MANNEAVAMLGAGEGMGSAVAPDLLEGSRVEGSSAIEESTADHWVTLQREPTQLPL